MYLDFKRKARDYIDTFGTYISDIDGSPMDNVMYVSRKGASSNVGVKSILIVSYESILPIVAACF